MSATAHSGRPVIAVFGATGAQGGGLVRALLRDPWRRFAVRALTRQPAARA
ncbi:MAG TPA: NmrA family NAD(P)-binding protein, partial [Roseateles sp.]|uniref:NmrA family NAD(P)-binding protein n=1 Tax=Roseateles sp. TaxID=1971397 RepID=UPI002EDA827F